MVTPSHEPLVPPHDAAVPSRHDPALPSRHDATSSRRDAASSLQRDAAAAHREAGAPRQGSRESWVGKGLFAVALVFLLREAEAVLVPVAIAVVLTFLLSSPVRWLRRHGVPEVIGAGLLVGALLAAAVLIASTLAAPAAAWWQRAPAMLDEAVQQFDRLRAAIPLLAAPAPRAAPTHGGDPAAARAAPHEGTAGPPAGAGEAAAAARTADPVKERIASEGFALTGAVLRRVASFGVASAAVLILLYFLLASEHWLLSRTVEAIARRRTRALVLSGIRHAEREIGQFVGAVTLVNIGLAIACTLAFMLIGLQDPVLWGAVCGALAFVFYIGPIIAVGLLLMAGLTSFEGWAVLGPAGAFLLIHAVEANFLSPLFIARRLALSPVAVCVAVLFWGWLWGLAGALLAVPLLVGLRSACRRVRRLHLLCLYLEGGRSEPPSLRSLLRAGPRRSRRERQSSADVG